MSVRAVLFALPFAAISLTASADPLTHGIQPQNMDVAVKSGDDFDLYANGGWVKTATIPPDQSNWGSFTILRDKASARTVELIEGLTKQPQTQGSIEQKVGDYYTSYMDAATIEAKGLAPLRAELDRIATIKDKHELATVLGAGMRADVDPLNNTNFVTENLFGLWVAPQLNDPSRNTAYLLQGGLGLPDRDYYLSDNAKMVAIRAAYVAHITRMLTLGGIADAQKKAAAIMVLETRIAGVHASRADSEDVLKANNRWARADFSKKAPGLDWPAFFDAASLSHQSDVTVWHAQAIPAIAAIVGDTSIDVWKDFLTFHLLNHYAGELPKAFGDAHFTFYGSVLQGTPQQADRSKRAVAATNDSLGWAVGKLYVARYFPPSAKATAQKMVERIVAAFGRRIDALAWMSPETKARAKRKLATLYVGIGYPDTWIDYDTLDVVRGDALGNAQRAEQFEYHRNLALLDKPADHTQWCMTPQTVNAVNLPLQNALNFPAAILDQPFFDAEADSAFNYGAIGSVIGHEISHSFDDQGSQFDADGRLINWWQPADYAHFRDAADRLVAQYDGYKPFPDLAVRGRQTLSENIADLAGLSAALDAWHDSLHGRAAPIMNGLTGEQRFFVAHAQSRQQITRDAALRRQVLTDGHAPANYRTFTVRNIDAWYKAFDVKPDEKLYLAPDRRVRVW